MATHYRNAKVKHDETGRKLISLYITMLKVTAIDFFCCN